MFLSLGRTYVVFLALCRTNVDFNIGRTNVVTHCRTYVGSLWRLSHKTRGILKTALFCFQFIITSLSRTYLEFGDCYFKFVLQKRLNSLLINCWKRTDESLKKKLGIAVHIQSNNFLFVLSILVKSFATVTVRMTLLASFLKNSFYDKYDPSLNLNNLI